MQIAGSLAGGDGPESGTEDHDEGDIRQQEDRLLEIERQRQREIRQINQARELESKQVRLMIEKIRAARHARGRITNVLRQKTKLRDRHLRDTVGAILASIDDLIKPGSVMRAQPDQ